MYIQINNLNRIVSWNLQESTIGSDSSVIKDITVPSGVDENNFFDYVWQSDNTLLLSPAPVVVVDNKIYLPQLRAIRDEMLTECDWRVAVSDYPYADLTAWLTYRQELRDFPSTYVPVESPVWPTSP